MCNIIHKVIVDEPLCDLDLELLRHCLDVVLENVRIDKRQHEEPGHAVDRVVVAPMVLNLLRDDGNVKGL